VIQYTLVDIYINVSGELAVSIFRLQDLSTGMDGVKSKGTAMWPEEELEDLVCGVTCAIVTVILRL
jgi:hypothetical protein